MRPALIVRLLRLTPTRALPLIGEIEAQAAHRFESIDAVRSHDGRVFATEDLRFSHYLTNATRYLTERA